MYAASLAYPLWWRMADRASWRMLWNLAVLAVFGQLLFHASTTGVRHLLESGLLLAVFCQVHMLNVLQRRQNADLVYFNSFLIALVTSFFVQDVVYSIVFVGYAFAFVLALHLNSIAFGDHEIETGSLERLGPRALARAGSVIAATTVLFFVVPRDFHRQGLVGDEIGWQQQVSGFSEDIQLGRSGATMLSERVVMRLRTTDSRDLGRIPSHWRGATSEIYSNEAWRRVAIRTQRHLPDPRWRLQSATDHSRSHKLPVADSPLDHLTIEAAVYTPHVTHLFLPLQSVHLRLGPGGDSSLARLEENGTCRYPLRRQSGLAPEEPTAVWWATVAKHLEPRDRTLAPIMRRTYTQLSSGDVPPAATDALRQASAHPRASLREKVESCNQWLYNNRVYLLPGEQGAARNLADFFEGAAGGHCEYFATALTIMLRMQQIPCRIVSGYLAVEQDVDRNEIIVRDKHAHAWVEVWEDERGWFEVDPTPAAELGRQGHQVIAEDGWWQGTLAPLESLWASITRFDAESRNRLIQTIATSPLAVARAVARRPFASLSLAFVLGCAIYALHRRRERRMSGIDRARRAWRHALRQAKLRPERDETPRELLTRARRTIDVPDEVLAQLVEATNRHEEACYAGE